MKDLWSGIEWSKKFSWKFFLFLSVLSHNDRCQLEIQVQERTFSDVITLVIFAIAAKQKIHGHK